MDLSKKIQDKIKASILGQVKERDIERTTNLHLYKNILNKGHKLKGVAGEVVLERNSALVFADLAPNFNWAHPCEYHLYDAKTGEHYKKILASLPPTQLILTKEPFIQLHAPVKPIDTKVRRSAWRRRALPLFKAPSASPGQRYAILFAGKAENRHTNDLEFLYRTLIDIYGFDAANILVLNHDGTVNYFTGSSTSATIGNNLGKWPGDNTPYRMVVTGAGTRAGFQAAFNDLAGRMKEEDFLFIHTNNHGGGPCDGYNDYCMFVYDANGNWVPYYVNDFITDMGVLPRMEVLMVMMEQCRSGGFINPIINNSAATWTHVATAVTENDYSLGGANFDPFAEDWIAGIAGHYPDGSGLAQAADSNNDGRVSAVEAFNYADAVHSYNGAIQRYCPPPNGTPLRLGDTPTESDSPGGFGSNIFLGLPAHDLYLRDNLQDHGREPLIGGGISCSPDIIIFNQELLDPEATLGNSSAQDSDILGSDVEAGQDNFLYFRVQNRGSQPTSGKIKAYWTTPSTLPTPSSWTQIGIPLDIPAVDPDEMKIVGPLVWKKADIPGKGHYCFVGLVESGDDPAPDPTSILTLDDYYNLIRQSNNVTWKNFDVIDMFANSIQSINFHIMGWPRKKLKSDLMIDLSELPNGCKVGLRILKRLSLNSTLEEMLLVKESGLYRSYDATVGEVAYLRDMDLKSSDDCVATMQVFVPETVPDGNYRIRIAQIVDCREMGRVTKMLAVGMYPYMVDERTSEVHDTKCEWAAKISPRNRGAYKDLEMALKHGYNGCKYCMREYDTG